VALTSPVSNSRQPEQINVNPIDPYILLSALIFVVGAVGFLVRRNVIFTLISIEVMLNAVNLAVVAFNRTHSSNHTGHVFAFYMIAAAAAEAAIGLALVLSLYRLKRTVRSDEADLLRY
jgi:NADH-quinone oxidoreductase subunit K